MDQDYNFPFEGLETLRLERTAGIGPYQHDRNQSLPNAALQRDHSIRAGVRPAQSGHIFAWSSTHTWQTARVIGNMHR